MTTCGFRFPISDCPDAAPEHAQQRASRGAECGLQQLGHGGGGHLKVRVKGMEDAAQGGRAMGVHEGVAEQLPRRRPSPHPSGLPPATVYMIDAFNPCLPHHSWSSIVSTAAPHHTADWIFINALN